MAESQASAPPADPSDFDQLTRHIVARHHDYVRQITPVIQAWLDKLVTRHGAGHPELAQVRAAFAQLTDDLHAHMLKEENILFPFVDALAAASRGEIRRPPSPFGTVLNPIRMMEHEHEQADGLMAQIRGLTRCYNPPEDGCTTYRLCYEELARYDADLQRHVHLENDVLFPGAVTLEQELR